MSLYWSCRGDALNKVLLSLASLLPLIYYKAIFLLMFMLQVLSAPKGLMNGKYLTLPRSVTSSRCQTPSPCPPKKKSTSPLFLSPILDMGKNCFPSLISSPNGQKRCPSIPLSLLSPPPSRMMGRPLLFQRPCFTSQPPLIRRLTPLLSIHILLPISSIHTNTFYIFIFSFLFFLLLLVSHFIS